MVYYAQGKHTRFFFFFLDIINFTLYDFFTFNKKIGKKKVISGFQHKSSITGHKIRKYKVKRKKNKSVEEVHYYKHIKRKPILRKTKKKKKLLHNWFLG